MSPINSDSNFAAEQHTATENSLLLSDVDAYLGASSPLSLLPVEVDATDLDLKVSSFEMPVIGLIDSGFDDNLINMDSSQLMAGTDYFEADQEDTLHGSALANIIVETGINAPVALWLSNTVGSGQWANALVEFVDTVKQNGQERAIANLSFDLVQPNVDGELIPREWLTQEEFEALAYAQQNNVIVVAAAGNDDAAISALGATSAYFDNVITVGAADGMERADYSNYGSSLDLLAPGGGGEGALDSSIDSGIEGYEISGTSVAAAIVSGSIADVWAENPDLSYIQVLDLIKTTATDLYTPGPDIYSGAGLINVDEALQQAPALMPEPLSMGQSSALEWSGSDGHGTDETIGIERALMISAPTLGNGTSGRLEAEDFGLEGYRADTIGSIRSIAVTKDTGTAVAKFGGNTGVYTLRVLFYEESDGEASFSFKAGDKTYNWTADGASKYDYPTPNNGVVREFKNVRLTKGETIEFTGQKDGGERARIDYVEFEQSGTSAPSSAPSSAPTAAPSSAPVATPIAAPVAAPTPSTTPTPSSPAPSPTATPPSLVDVPATRPITIQAEDFNLNGFVVERDTDATGQQLIKTSNKGTAQTKFTGSTGTYDITVNYFDEQDGRSPISLKAEGQTFNWVANKNLQGTVATKANRTSQTFKGITLNNGSTIELGGQRQSQEYARIDSVVFTPKTTLNNTPSRPVSNSDTLAPSLAPTPAPAPAPAPALAPTPTVAPHSNHTPTPTPSPHSGSSNHSHHSHSGSAAAAAKDGGLHRITQGSSGSTSIKSSPTSRSGHGVRIYCTPSHFANHDPVVFPNQPGRSHLHVFFGNTEASAASTPSSLLHSGDSTCEGGTNVRSSYWAPAVMNSVGEAVIPSSSWIYYKTFMANKAFDKLQPVPNGLQMLASRETKGYKNQLEVEKKVFNNHTREDSVKLTANFPNCIATHNGQRTGNPILDYRDMPGAAGNIINSHVAYAEGPDKGPKNEVGCPSSHPYRIPTMSIHQYYSLDDLQGGWSLASDTPGDSPGESFHADYIAAWDPESMAQITDCNINPQNCEFSGGRRQLPERLFSPDGDQLFDFSQVVSPNADTTPFGDTLKATL